MENYTEITAFPYGTVSAPPSKSAAHRSLICAALAGAGSKVSNLELSKDIEATLRCIKAMGGEYNFENGSLEIIKGITKPKNGIELDCGESGSTLRFFIPIAAAFGTEVTFVGAKRLFERPLQPYYDTFKDRGIDLFAEGDSLTVTGRLGKGLYILAGNVSSQFVTGLLLSLGIVGGGEVRISTPLESKGYVDLTIAQMKLFGVQVTNDNYSSFMVANGGFKPYETVIEGDYSNGAFMLGAAALGAKVAVSGLNPTSAQGDKAFLNFLESVGARVVVNSSGALQVEIDKGLRAVDIDVSQIPDLVPPIAAVLCFCKGKSHILNAARLRLKESDRLQTVKLELQHLGAIISEIDDGLEIEGVENLVGGKCETHNDHRIAMMCALAAIKCKSSVYVDNSACVEKSYPSFWKDFCKKVY